MPSDHRLLPARPDVIDELFGEEAVLVNLRTGRYYSLEGSAGALWSAIVAGGATIAELADILAAPVEAVLPFVRRLADEELITIEGAALPAGGDEGEVPAERRPRLVVFTDMEDILLLDPIHDIDLDGTGWPAPQSSEAV
jgi:hypothetical protein